MRVLITGALGFIGSHLADALLAAGDEVLGIDDLSGNVVDDLPGATIVHDDARAITSLRAGRVDLVVHAASPVGPVALLDRESIVAEIIETTQAVLRFCDQHQLPLINISSSEVYGFSGTYREFDDCVVSPRLSHRLQYASGKLAAEQLVRTSRVPSVTIRPFNVAGPRQSAAKGFVIPTFCEQALAERPLTVFDGGDQERCPTGVWDLVDFILRVGRDPHRFAGGVFNVGHPGNRTTVLDLARMVLRLTGSSSPVEHTTGKAVHGPAYEEARGRVKVPDITRARTTGWQPRVGLEDLIRLTIQEIVAGDTISVR
ncbi:MAG: NAD-dependent epimerase/dehydratase family protein [Steroidobacteraceae bacterium]|nr:NAD-dependent epimerase/dehydratase family protein [Steroidobacteraceae bacterium]